MNPNVDTSETFNEVTEAMPPITFVAVVEFVAVPIKLPTKEVAVTTPLIKMSPITSSFELGCDVPIPKLLL